MQDLLGNVYLKAERKSRCHNGLLFFVFFTLVTGIFGCSATPKVCGQASSHEPFADNEACVSSKEKVWAKPAPSPTPRAPKATKESITEKERIQPTVLCGPSGCVQLQCASPYQVTCSTGYKRYRIIYTNSQGHRCYRYKCLRNHGG